MSSPNESQAFKQIPLSQPELLPQDGRAVAEVLSGTQLALGPRIKSVRAIDGGLCGYAFGCGCQQWHQRAASHHPALSGSARLMRW